MSLVPRKKTRGNCLNNVIFSYVKSIVGIVIQCVTKFISMYLTLTIILLVISPLCESYPSRSERDVEGQFLRNVKYNNYKDLKKLFKNLEQKFPQMAKVHSIGKSVKKKDLLVMEINSNVEKVAPLTPKFKYVANIYGDEALGRQLIIYLAQYLLYTYGKSERITRLINSTDIFLMPSINPDGFDDALVLLIYFRSLAE